jgi:hypothetical protein
VIEKEADSGSADLYSQGLANAARNFTGTELQPDNLGLLEKSLLKVEEPPQKKEKPNFLGSLLSSLTGKTDASQYDQNIGFDELLRAGMTFFQTKQEGSSTTDALMGALKESSPLGQTHHRAMSGATVAATIMDFAKSNKK